MVEETARYILSVWLHEEHLEDAKLIPVSNFPQPYDAIAKDIRAGHPIEKIMTHHGLKQIAGIMGDYYPALYQANVQQILTEEMYRTLPEHATPQQLSEHALKYTRYWQERPKPVAIAERYWETIDKRSETEPIMSGIATVDDFTHGIYPGQLTIVGARPSVGKSAFCLQVAVNVAKRGRKVLFLPLEMSAAETMDRIVMRYVDQSVVKYRDIHRGRLSVEQTAEVTKVVNQIDTLSDSFLIYENVRDIEQIKTLIQTEHPDLIVIDQLSQIRNGNDQQTVRERYVEVTRTLKAIALEENVAIWLPCQMNRESSKSGMVSIDYLKESGSIEEDADIVLILSNKKDEDGNYEANDAGRKVKLEVAKNRQGRCGSEELIFIGPRFTFLSQTAEWVETTGYEQQF